MIHRMIFAFDHRAIHACYATHSDLYKMEEKTKKHNYRTFRRNRVITIEIKVGYNFMSVALYLRTKATSYYRAGKFRERNNADENNA